MSMRCAVMGEKVYNDHLKQSQARRPSEVMKVQDEGHAPSRHRGYSCPSNDLEPKPVLSGPLGS